MERRQVLALDDAAPYDDVVRAMIFDSGMESTLVDISCGTLDDIHSLRTSLNLLQDRQALHEKMMSQRLSNLESDMQNIIATLQHIARNLG